MKLNRLVVEYFVARFANSCSVVVVVLWGRFVQYFLVFRISDLWEHSICLDLLGIVYISHVEEGIFAITASYS